MELWKERVNAQKSTTNTVHNINGAQAINEVCDYLFYSEFSEDEIVPFFDIFDGFNKYYNKNDADNAIRQLDNNLSKQIKSLYGSALEMVLYASRKINEHIKEDKNVFNIITEILKNHIKNNYESIKCMANNWEWRMQLLMLAEACGKSFDNTAIKIMMDAYKRILSLFDEAKIDSVHLAFVRMILHTQNVENMNYLIDIVSSNSFVDNPNSFKVIRSQILAGNSFVLNNKDAFMEQLSTRNIPNVFKSKVANLIGYTSEAPSLEQEWEWGNKSASSITRLTFIHDKNELPQIIELFLQNWDKITGKLNQQRMLYTVAGKAAECEDYASIDAVQDFCEKILSSENEAIHSGAYLGLYALGDKSAIDKAIATAFKIENNYSSLVSLANYFRYKSGLIETSFIDFIEQELIQCEWDNYTVGNYIKNLSTVIDKFDGGENHDKLKSSENFNSRVIDISKLILKRNYDNSIYNDLLEILYKIGSESPTQTASVLKLLDGFKALEFDISPSILKRVDGMIKKLDGIAPPQ